MFLLICLVDITLSFVNWWLANENMFWTLLTITPGTFHAFLRMFEYAKGVVRSRKLKDRQYNDQKKKDNQWSTKHYTTPGVDFCTQEG
jgi:hypothetical protein